MMRIVNSWAYIMRTMQATEKLAQELAEDAVVIEYTGRCFRSSTCLIRVAVIPAPVSWNANQRFHVYTKRSVLDST